MLQRSAIKLQTQIHTYRGLPTSGRAKIGVAVYYSYIHVRTKSIYGGTLVSLVFPFIGLARKWRQGWKSR